MPKLVKRFGKKELCGFGTFFSAIAAILMYFIVPHCSRVGSGPVVFMLFTFIIGFGYSFVSITNWAIITDVIDYQEYKTGIRNESAVYSAYTFGRQFGQAVADAGGLFLLQWAKYDSLSAGNGFITANDTSKKIMFICTIIPAIVYTSVWLIFRFGYPLTKEKMEPIYEALRVKHEKEAQPQIAE
jgi:GPH family glycoside/pentoside/hexuronide:cation symporter